MALFTGTMHKMSTVCIYILHEYILASWNECLPDSVPSLSFHLPAALFLTPETNFLSVELPVHIHIWLSSPVTQAVTCNEGCEIDTLVGYG